MTPLVGTDHEQILRRGEPEVCHRREQAQRGLVIEVGSEVTGVEVGDQALDALQLARTPGAADEVVVTFE